MTAATPAPFIDPPDSFETLLCELSSRFISVPVEEIDREIEDVQRWVCQSLGADLSVLWQAAPGEPGDFRLTHFYTSRDDLLPPTRGMSATEYFPWLMDEMRANRPAVLASIHELPEAAAVDRANLATFGVKSDVTLPLSVGVGAPIGALNFNTTRAPRQWPDALVRRLQLVAQIFANVLARKRADMALRESEARMSLAADSADAGVWVFDYPTRTFWVAERTRKIFGYPTDLATTLSVFEASVHPDDRPRVLAALENATRPAGGVAIEYRIVRRDDGDVRWISSRGRPHFAPTGEPYQLMGVSLDVTDRKRAEEALVRSEARLAVGAELAGLGFAEVRFEEGVMDADDRLREICGFPPALENLQPVSFWLEHLHPEDRGRVLEVRGKLHDGALDRVSIEYRYMHPTRGVTWIHQVAAAGSRDSTGRALRMFGVFRDITERRQREEALRQSHAEVEKLKDKLQAESDYLKAEIRVTQARGELTGKSAAILHVLRQIEQVAPTDSTVLVRGETGSGKELVAQAIHRLSPRRSHLMVKVNCAALPSGLVESELFDREKGAFTDALTRQAGRFEVADGATLFLDEVGELSLDVQAKLLRVLESGEFERLGSSRTIKVNVRLVAATNRDLAEAIKQGRFRADLFYRLNVFPIRMPPLRERPEDIPALAWEFVQDFSSRMGKKITQVPRKTMEALQRQRWPGNVRELRNVIEHAAIISEGDTLRVALTDGAAVKTARKTLADLERAHIIQTLEETGGKVKGPNGAAAVLGLNPATLYSRMKRLGVRKGATSAE